MYISAAVAVVVLILAIWGGWKYVQNERINQANQYHIARAMLTNPALSEDERLTQGISALRDFAKSESGTTLSVLALMESCHSSAWMTLDFRARIHNVHVGSRRLLQTGSDSSGGSASSDSSGDSGSEDDDGGRGASGLGRQRSQTAGGELERMRAGTPAQRGA